MIGMIGIGVGGVGEDTETVTDFGVGQQEGPGTTCIKIEVQDIHEKYLKSMWGNELIYANYYYPTINTGITTCNERKTRLKTSHGIVYHIYKGWKYIENLSCQLSTIV